MDALWINFFQVPSSVTLYNKHLFKIDIVNTFICLREFFIWKKNSNSEVLKRFILFKNFGNKIIFFKINMCQKIKRVGIPKYNSCFSTEIVNIDIETYLFSLMRFLIFLSAAEIRAIITEDWFPLPHFLNTLESFIFSILGSEVAEGRP